MTAYRFSADEVRERAKKYLLQEVPAGHKRSDDDLNPTIPVNARAGDPRPASVLVPIVMHEPEVTVLMTQRTEQLSSHPGQISFPGGKHSEGDEDAVATALRETEEETGLDRDFVQPIGFLDPYLTRTNYRIVPVVGLVSGGFRLQPDAGEVASVFEVPLRFLMTAENHLIHERDWQGISRKFYAMTFGDHYIWGATAGMVKNFYDRMYATGITP